VQLFTKEAPNTTQNFMELARGKKSWRHPVTMVESNRPIFNNTTIYRIICDTIIFGGDPINKGAGDSGVMQNLETAPDLQFDQAGLLAMDGSNDKASGSRWFITLRPFPDRTGHYTIIGKVVGGLDVVRAISNKPCKKPQVPLDATLLNSIEIVDIPQGKRTTASFGTEDGRKVLSVDPNFSAMEAAPTPAPAEPETSATAATTTSSTTMTSRTVILK
jgi:peptidyl-prolyl cis-trans isomerase A (cyclophilin A)